MATAAVAVLLATAAQAASTTVYNTDLGAIAPGSTTTDSTGTRSTNPGGTLGGEAVVGDEWVQRNVRGNGEVGITTDYARSGNGSISFSLDGSNPSKADMEYYFSTPLALSSFEGATYDWYRDSSSTNSGVQTASLRLLLSGPGVSFAQLIFEPYYQGAPANVATDTWVTSTLNWSSTVWSPGNSVLTPPPGSSTCAIGCFSTLSNWATANQNLNVIGFSTGAGSGWTAGPFKGAVDNVGFTFAGDEQSFNFEVSAVPEPTTWALMISGFGLAGAALRRRNRAAIAA